MTTLKAMPATAMEYRDGELTIVQMNNYRAETITVPDWAITAFMNCIIETTEHIGKEDDHYVND